MKRLETETLDEYKIRRSEANFKLKQKLGRWLVWDSSTQGTKKGKFKKYTVGELQEYLDRPHVVIEEPVVTGEEVKIEEEEPTTKEEGTI